MASNCRRRHPQAHDRRGVLAGAAALLGRDGAARRPREPGRLVGRRPDVVDAHGQLGRPDERGAGRDDAARHHLLRRRRLRRVGGLRCGASPRRRAAAGAAVRADGALGADGRRVSSPPPEQPVSRRSAASGAASSRTGERRIRTSGLGVQV